ncbi:MAG: DUF3134 domain-containing protein [Xenococcaceae cyanobacterium MO_167.B52]|nr:DUF3134 domain-containing protein [Xenococcaceae cyanobacterium MO_167.B52]
MSQVKNPALSQEPRYEPAIVMPIKQKTSLLDWLRANDRLIAREHSEPDKIEAPEVMDDLLDNEEDDFVDDDLDED